MNTSANALIKINASAANATTTGIIIATTAAIVNNGANIEDMLAPNPDNPALATVASVAPAAASAPTPAGIIPATSPKPSIACPDFFILLLLSATISTPSIAVSNASEISS